MEQKFLIENVTIAMKKLLKIQLPILFLALY